MLMSDFQKQFSRSVLKRYSAELRSDLDEVFEELTAEARTVLKHDGFSKETSVLLPELDLRYRGQSYELTVPFEEGYHHTFHEKHRRLYSYSLDDDECEVVNARLLAVGRTPTIRIRKRRAAGSDAEPIKRKGVFFNGSHQQFAVYLREGLAPGHRIEGPAVIAGRDSTVVVAPDFKAEVDPYASLILTRKS
jgi:N-methylhydantoinase A